MGDAATTVMERCERLGVISEEPGALTRPYGSETMREVNEVVSGWMRAAGMSVRQDEIGNLIGLYEGTGGKTLLLGSHLDTVRDAGKYDGILGVMVAIACVQGLYDRGERPPCSIEVVAFADEEGLRFGTTFLGSSVYAGAFDEKRLDLKDKGGVTLAEAVRELSALLAEAVEMARLTVHRLPSGAGHDAAQVATLAPVAMLFVRCKEGISHNPAESVTREDVGAAIEVMRNLLSLVSRKMDTGTAEPDRAHPQERREKG